MPPSRTSQLRSHRQGSPHGGPAHVPRARPRLRPDPDDSPLAVDTPCPRRRRIPLGTIEMHLNGQLVKPKPGHRSLKQQVQLADDPITPKVKSKRRSKSRRDVAPRTPTVPTAVEHLATITAPVPVLVATAPVYVEDVEMGDESSLHPGVRRKADALEEPVRLGNRAKQWEVHQVKRRREMAPFNVEEFDALLAKFAALSLNPCIKRQRPRYHSSKYLERKRFRAQKAAEPVQPRDFYVPFTFTASIVSTPPVPQDPIILNSTHPSTHQQSSAHDLYEQVYDHNTTILINESQHSCVYEQVGCNPQYGMIGTDFVGHVVPPYFDYGEVTDSMALIDQSALMAICSASSSMESVLFDGQEKMVICTSLTTVHFEDDSEAMEICSASSSMQSVLFEGQEKMDVCCSSSTTSLMSVEGGAHNLAHYEDEKTLGRPIEALVGGTFDHGFDASPITARTVRFSDSLTIVYEYDPSLPIDTSGHVIAANDNDNDARKFDVNLDQQADDFLNLLGAELVEFASSDVAKAEAEQYKHSSNFLEYLSPLSAILGVQLSSPSFDISIDRPNTDSAGTAFEEPSPSMPHSLVTPSGSCEDVSAASPRSETRYCDIPGAFDLDDFDDDW